MSVTFSLKRSLVIKLTKAARKDGVDSIVSRSRFVEQLLEAALQ
jgi:hypothetical protein